MIYQLTQPEPTIRFSRRLGYSPQALGLSRAGENCPDLWLFSNGNIGAVGRDRTEELRHHLPSDVSVGHDEKLIELPHSLVMAALPDLNALQRKPVHTAPPPAALGA